MCVFVVGFFFFFFFQAEDGIRDRSPSRGLGDVYKRQPLTLPVILPVTASPASKACSSTAHDRARRAFSRDNLVSPKPSSTASSATSTISPTCTLSSPRSLRN